MAGLPFLPTWHLRYTESLGTWTSEISETSEVWKKLDKQPSSALALGFAEWGAEGG